VVLGTLILEEPFNTRMALAAAVVFAGMVLVRSKSEVRSLKSEAPQTSDF